MELPKTVEVTYEWTDDLAKALEWFKEIDANYKLVGLDFEAAVKYSDEDVAEATSKLEDDTISFDERLRYQQVISTTALSHPSHSYPTHLNIGLSESEAYVIIIVTHEMLDLVMNWLTTTTIKQIWHNAGYDFKHIYYHTHRFPKDYEDTQLLAKTVLNHVEIYKARTGLKELMGEDYGAWGIAASNFTVEQIYAPHVLKYAAIDGCATWLLFKRITDFIEEQ